MTGKTLLSHGLQKRRESRQELGIRYSASAADVDRYGHESIPQTPMRTSMVARRHDLRGRRGAQLKQCEA